MKEKMVYRVVMCHDVSGNEDRLTLDQLYWCRDHEYDMIQIMDDTGQYNWYCAEAFQ